jgi:glycosyltransferase involved in cell wall biosynthesis
MKRDLRILLMSGSAPPIACGVGDYTACLASELDTIDGIKVALLTAASTNTSERTSVLKGVELIEPFSNWHPLNFFSARCAILKWRPDLLHIQWPASAAYKGALLEILPLWFHFFYHKPVVLTLHEHILPWMKWTLMMAKSSTVVTSVRPNFSDGFRNGLSISVASKPLHYISNASSLPKVKPSSHQVAAVRKSLGVENGKPIIAYFGLLYPDRGVHQLFQIANPDEHHLVIVGGSISVALKYHQDIIKLSQKDPWLHRTSITGFLPSEEAALILSCADAVVLPFLGGGGIWNTSIHGARLQETFVLTTSATRRGYDCKQNVYWAEPNNIEEMRVALSHYLGFRHKGSSNDVPLWPEIASQHAALYKSLLPNSDYHSPRPI